MLRKIITLFLLIMTAGLLGTLSIAVALDPGGYGSWGSTNTPDGAGRGADPWTYFEENGRHGIPNGAADGSGKNRAYYGYGANGPGYASSFWSYFDSKDTTPKPEGSYGFFLFANGWDMNGTQRSDNLGAYTDGQRIVNVVQGGGDSPQGDVSSEGLVGILSNRSAPVWIIPNAIICETPTVAISDNYVHLIKTEGDQFPFRVHTKLVGSSLQVSIGDKMNETTDALSDSFYEGFQDATVTATYIGQVDSPHDSYDQKSDKCRVCHAVHRAGGARRLSRADTWKEACSYCHKGNHRHASLQLPSETTTATGHGLSTLPVNDWTASGHETIPY
jgi:hypothetical protein